VRRHCERPPFFIGGRDKRQKHDVSLIALETVRIAAHQTAPFHFLGSQSLKQLILNQGPLGLALKHYNPHRLVIVPAVTEASHELLKLEDGLLIAHSGR